MTKADIITIRSKLTMTTDLGEFLKRTRRAKLITEPEFYKAVFALGVIEGALTAAHDRAREKEGENS